MVSVVVDGDRALVAALLGGDRQPARAVEPGGEQIAAVLQREVEGLLSLGENKQLLASRVIHHPGLFRVGEHRVLQGQHLLGVQVPGEGVVPGAGGGGQHQSAVQIGEGDLLAAGVGKGLCLSRGAGLQAAVAQPALQGVQIEPVPVGHQEHRAQQQGGGEDQGQQPEENIRLFLLFLMLHHETFILVKIGLMGHRTSSSYQRRVMYSPPGGTVGPARVRLPDSKMAGMSWGESFPSAA